MFLDILGALLVASHIVTVAIIVLWFGLGKPRSRKEFWRRFKGEFLSLTPPSQR